MIFIKHSRTIGAALGAILLVAGAPVRAQEPAPAAPSAPQAPAAPQAPQTPQTPQTPQAAQDKVVVVNPAAATPQTTTMVDTEARSPGAGLITTGLVVFGVTYGASVIAASSSSLAADNRLYVPLLGPWLNIGDRPSCGIDNQSCDRETSKKVLLVADGIFQAAGVLAVLSGVFTSNRDRTVSTRTTASLHVVPTSMAQGSPGLVAFGSF